MISYFYDFFQVIHGQPNQTLAHPIINLQNSKVLEEIKVCRIKSDLIFLYLGVLDMMKIKKISISSFGLANFYWINFEYFFRALMSYFFFINSTFI